MTGCFIVIVIGLFWFGKTSIFRPNEVVLPAITKDIADGMLKEKECYILRVADDTFDLSYWYYMEGKEKKPIRLIGNGPRDELSYIFMEPNRNRFLVKGNVNEQLTEHYNELIFFVEEWHLIAPIKRDYGWWREEEQRFFYPRNYLDVYDVEQGDYNPVNTYDLVWNRPWEYYLEQEGYYKIRSRWNGSELEWFLIYDEKDFEKYKSDEVRRLEEGYVEKRILIEGNSPEYLLGAAMLNNGYDDDKCIDFFIAKGDLKDSEDGIERLEIYKWWIDAPFIHKDAKGFMIKSSEGFNQSDIEAGIYKSYR